MAAFHGAWRLLKSIIAGGVSAMVLLQVAEYFNARRWFGADNWPIAHEAYATHDMKKTASKGLQAFATRAPAASGERSAHEGDLQERMSHGGDLQERAPHEGDALEFDSPSSLGEGGPRVQGALSTGISEKPLHAAGGHEAERDWAEAADSLDQSSSGIEQKHALDAGTPKAMFGKPADQSWTGNPRSISQPALISSVCVPEVVEYTSSGFPAGRPVLGIQVCNDQTPDPKRKSAPAIRSYERQLRQTTALLKSVLLLSRTSFHVALVVDTESTFSQVLKLFKSWPQSFCKRMSISKHFLYYPKKAKFLKYLNRPCSSQRHFFPETFAHTDLIINIDTDVILLASLEELWSHFDKFDSMQMIGMAAMSYDVQANHPMFARFPKPHHELIADGINTGISLFSLDRWRTRYPNYTDMVVEWYEKYGSDFVFPTQDLFNVFLKTHPQIYYNLPCNWNVRPTLCQTRVRERRTGKSKKRGHEICAVINTEGMKALHGAGGHFVTEDAYPWYTMFEAFETYDMAKHTWNAFTESLHKSVSLERHDQFDCVGTFGVKHYQKYFLMQTAIIAQDRARR